MDFMRKEAQQARSETLHKTKFQTPGQPEERQTSGTCLHCFFCQQKKTWLFNKIFYQCEKSNKKTGLSDTCGKFWGATQEVIAGRIRTWK